MFLHRRDLEQSVFRNACNVYDLITDRIQYELRGGVHMYLPEDIAAVRFCCLNTHGQHIRHFFCAVPFGNKLHDFFLTGGQDVGAAMLPGEIQKYLSYTRRKTRPSMENDLDARQKIICTFRFDDEPLDSDS